MGPIALSAVVVSVAQVLLGLCSLVKTVAFLVWGRLRERGEQVTDCHDDLLVLIPCLDEQDRITATLDHCVRVFPGDGSCRIAVVTVREEGRESESTSAVVRRYIKEHPGVNVELCRYDGKPLMAAQLNYAVRTLGTMYDYVAVFNADSRPPEGTYPAVARLMTRGCPVVQQYSAMTQNFEGLGPIMKAFALYQTNYELKSGFLACTLRSPFRPPHLVGHGLFVNRMMLEELGGFDEENWCEDVAMSFLVSNRGIPVETLNNLEEAEAPVSLRAQFLQHATWFKTAFDVKGLTRAEKGPVSFQGVWYLARRWALSFSWLLSPVAIVGSAVILGVLLGPLGLVMGVGSFLFMCAAEYGTTVVLMNTLGIRKNPIDLTVGMLLTPVARLLSCLGPLRSFCTQEKRRTPKGV